MKYAPDMELSHAVARPRRFGHSLYLQVLAGVALGVLIGWLWPDAAMLFKPLGDAFIRLVRMMIVPVVFCTIVTGIAGVGQDTKVGPTLLKTFGLFYVLTVAALMIGLATVALLQPGAGMHIAPASIDPAEAARYASHATKLDFVGVLLHIIPTSFFSAFADGEVLPALLVAIILGFGLRRAGTAGHAFLGGLESFSRGLFAGFGFIMRLAPLGAFGAMAFIVAQSGLRTIGSLGLLIVSLYVASIVFVAVILGVLCRLHGFSLWRLLRYFREEFLVVLGTASTEPVLPSVLLKLERLGCSKASVGLTLPLGYSFNLDGTAIYLTLAFLFLAQAMDIHLSAGQIFSAILVMLLTSKGAAGVTGSGFAALVATLAAMPHSVPVAGVVLIAGIDRFMSEARALTSLASNAVACIVIAIWDRACDREVLRGELARAGENLDAIEPATLPPVRMPV
jgi:aerobic C4-dicarboxylate transport protein